MSLSLKQSCPYCGYQEDPASSEWDEGEHVVLCIGCGKDYEVNTYYKFIGFEVNRLCQACNEKREDCTCDEFQE